MYSTPVLIHTDGCDTVSKYYCIFETDLYAWNLGLHKTCDNMDDGTQVCVHVKGYNFTRKDCKPPKTDGKPPKKGVKPPKKGVKPPKKGGKPPKKPKDPTEDGEPQDDELPETSYDPEP
ncbi:hypothetical protein BC938DRAFT_476281 [Jimgerdemannia flammicorona]|uniref:Uncharacterized protein n=1 Tax=Jimgerdemannia flammicorona TaxID=994334 RepID=A0A433QQP9_9FUNG|nr:hypothetical protein BC938DRAFT_476281 [Jimgerdemannia flammicorona]